MIRAFVEAPAGLAAVSLRLHGGQHCRPPISRMGNKAGYSAVILAALGLRSGEGAGCYVWAEADPDVRALLRAYPDADMLRRIAEIIRGWKDEEPRALWERLRAERKARPPLGDEGVANWVLSSMWSYEQGNVRTGFVGPGERRQDTSAAAAAAACKNLAEYAQLVASNRLIPGATSPDGRWVNAARDGGPHTDGGASFGGESFATPAAEVASGFERVAGWITEHAGTHPGSEGFRGLHIHRPNVDGFIPGRGALAAGCDRLASRWPPVAVLATIPDTATLSTMLGTPGDLEGVVCYMDPPYVGTTGYADDLPRADVVRLALDYHRAGAVVCVSEAVPVDELVAVGWHAADIGAGRRGQRRTFARVATEVLTMNREPAHRVATQQRMFGG